MLYLTVTSGLIPCPKRASFLVNQIEKINLQNSNFFLTFVSRKKKENETGYRKS